MNNKQITNVSIYGLENAVRVSKFPMIVDTNKATSEITKTTDILGRAKAGTGHNQFLTGIIVQFDLRATNKFWVEFERYHFQSFISSQSTMHRITKFDLDNAYIEYVDKRVIEIMQEKIKLYNTLEDGEEKKKLYKEILYTNPAGFYLTAGITTSYLQLKTQYAQRKNHRLDEWKTFCEWIETLPHSEWITGE